MDLLEHHHSRFRGCQDAYNVRHSRAQCGLPTSRCTHVLSQVLTIAGCYMLCMCLAKQTGLKQSAAIHNCQKIRQVSMCMHSMKLSAHAVLKTCCNMAAHAAMLIAKAGSCKSCTVMQAGKASTLLAGQDLAAVCSMAGAAQITSLADIYSIRQHSAIVKQAAKTSTYPVGWSEPRCCLPCTCPAR